MDEIAKLGSKEEINLYGLYDKDDLLYREQKIRKEILRSERLEKMAEPLIKKRKIAIAGMGNAIDADGLKIQLEKKEGVISANLNKPKRKLEIEYDLWKINFEIIEKSLVELGLGLSQKIAERIKRGMAKFTEQNELDNLKANPVSCGLCPNESCRKKMNGS